MAAMATIERIQAQATRRAQRMLLSLGDDVRHARLASGVSQKQIGREARMSGSSVSRVEAGKLNGLSVADREVAPLSQHKLHSACESDNPSPPAAANQQADHGAPRGSD